jgi:hypothetical protein
VAKKSAAGDDFAAVFDRLRAILEPHAKRMVVVKDDPDYYSLATTKLGPNKRPVCFAFVKVGTGYVSFHLMPVYGNPRLLASVSGALKRRMQGKACFNFKTVDDDLFAELAALTKAGYEYFKLLDWA